MDIKMWLLYVEFRAYLMNAAKLNRGHDVDPTLFISTRIVGRFITVETIVSNGAL